MKAIVLFALLAASSLLTACGHELFSEANTGSYNRRIDTYYEGDSAVQTREQRRRIEETGFGYSPGMFGQ